jgi:hypothetical protein
VPNVGGLVKVAGHRPTGQRWPLIVIAAILPR